MNLIAKNLLQLLGVAESALLPTAYADMLTAAVVE
jgi:hypothetical protein